MIRREERTRFGFRRPNDRTNESLQSVVVILRINFCNISGSISSYMIGRQKVAEWRREISCNFENKHTVPVCKWVPKRNCYTVPYWYSCNRSAWCFFRDFRSHDFDHDNTVGSHRGSVVTLERSNHFVQPQISYDPLRVWIDFQVLPIR